MEFKSDGNDVTSVPYIVYESAEMRAERRYKRLLIVLIITIVLMFISNAIWLYEWTSYDYVSTETIIEAQDGMANYHSDNNRCKGDTYYGEDYTEIEGES
jgi:hypothetical protein